jgi:type III secretory pathway component EscU
MLRSVPIIIIIVLTFILIFSGTKLTINAATDLSTTSLLILLISQVIILYYGLMHKQLYINVIAALIMLGVIYTLYIKQIYMEEAEIINELKRKDIIEEDTKIFVSFK